MPGAKILTGWGVKIRLKAYQRRRARRGEPKVKDEPDQGWQLICRPGTDLPLSTNLSAARAYLRDYLARGVDAELVEVPAPRGRSGRPRPRRDPLEQRTGNLFG